MHIPHGIAHFLTRYLRVTHKHCVSLGQAAGTSPYGRLVNLCEFKINFGFIFIQLNSWIFIMNDLTSDMNQNMGYS